MKTKILALTITFAAVTIFLNPRFSGLAIPSFVPKLWFQFWEIPVFTAFLLFGIKPSLFVATLNTIVLLLISPGTSFNEPVSNLLAVCGTLIGMFLVANFIIGNRINQKFDTSLKAIGFSTFIGILIRLVVMLPWIYLTSFIVGTLAIIVPLLPMVVLYDSIVVLYSVPIAYIIAKAVYPQLKSHIET
jgi:hypothetical protein